jgi:hypothetical protein
LAEKYPSAPATPAQVSEQAAAARIQPVAPQPLAPEQQAIVDQVRARAQAQEEAARATRVAALQQRAQAAGGYTPPAAQTPAATTAPANSLEALRSRLTPQTPEQLAAVEAYNALSPKDKAAHTRAQRNAPPDVTNMMTDEQAAMMNALKLPNNASAMERKIATGTQAMRDKLEAELGKHLRDSSVDRATKEIISGYMNLFDKYRNK